MHCRSLINLRQCFFEPFQCVGVNLIMKWFLSIAFLCLFNFTIHGEEPPVSDEQKQNIKPTSILLIRLYQSPNFKTMKLQQSLLENGFAMEEISYAPSADSLDRFLGHFDQCWIVSDYVRHLDSSHIPVFMSFLQKGNALYLLADNEPYDADVEFISKALTGAEFTGNIIADKDGQPMMDADLELSENLDSLYEGFTISAISIPEAVKPQFVSSNGQVMIASCRTSSYKILLDGGFTRMFAKWDHNSARYFVNAANWLSSN